MRVHLAQPTRALLARGSSADAPSLFRVEGEVERSAAAMPPAARAPPNALVVFCPAGASPEHPVVLAANDRVVTRTAFLDWADAPAVGVGAGSARKQLTTSQALRAFGRRLRFTQVAAQRPVVMPGVLEIAFTGAAWSKYLGELLASGLLLANFDSLHTLEAAIDGLTIVSMALGEE